jgi:hypothetical protein
VIAFETFPSVVIVVDKNPTFFVERVKRVRSSAELRKLDRRRRIYFGLFSRHACELTLPRSERPKETVGSRRAGLLPTVSERSTGMKAVRLKGSPASSALDPSLRRTESSVQEGPLHARSWEDGCACGDLHWVMLRSSELGSERLVDFRILQLFQRSPQAIFPAESHADRFF